MAGLAIGGAWDLDEEPEDLGAGLPVYSAGGGGGGLSAVPSGARSPFLTAAQEMAQPALRYTTERALNERTAQEQGALEKARSALTREKSAWDSPLLRMGLEMMAASAIPGATVLGSVGRGGRAALDHREQQKAQDELRELKLAQIEQQINSLPYRNAMEQLALAGKLGAVKASSPFVSAGRGVMFNTESGEYVKPPAGVGVSGSKRVFGSAETGYYTYDPTDDTVKPVVGGKDPTQDPRVVSRLREQYLKMAENYGWPSLDDKQRWVETQVETALRGMRAPGPTEVGASPKTPAPQIGAVAGDVPKPIRGPAQEKAAIKEAEKDAELAVKDWDEVRNAANAASLMRSSITSIRGIDADTGRLAPLKEAVGGWLQALPFVKQDLQVIKDAEDLQKLNSHLERMVLNESIIQKGVMTEGDARRMRSTFGNLTNTKEANDYILRVMDAQAATQQLRRRLSQSNFDNKGMTRRQALDAWDKNLDKDNSFLIKQYNGKEMFINEFLEKMRAYPEYAKMPEDEFYERALLSWRSLK